MTFRYKLPLDTVSGRPLTEREFYIVAALGLFNACITYPVGSKPRAYFGAIQDIIEERTGRQRMPN